MLTLTCALCEKKSNYSTEELCGRYFMCKNCHWLNLMQTNTPEFSDRTQSQFALVAATAEGATHNSAFTSRL